MPAKAGISKPASIGKTPHKRTFLDRQKAGNKRIRQFGRVEMPQEAVINALKMEGEGSASRVTCVSQDIPDAVAPNLEIRYIDVSPHKR